MKGDPTCPRCGNQLRAPGLLRDQRECGQWECETHGPVPPLHPVGQPTTEAVLTVLRRAMVPVWAPWPLPRNWLLTGITDAGDETTGSCAVAVACSGPNPCGTGPGDLVLVAEEPGVGLGARYAGLPGTDPGPRLWSTAAHAKIIAAGHPTALWCVEGAPDRAVFIGEALGMWLWAVLWPATSGHLMYDNIVLTDLRDAGAEVNLLPFGALSPHLLGN